MVLEIYVSDKSARVACLKPCHTQHHGKQERREKIVRREKRCVQKDYGAFIVVVPWNPHCTLTWVPFVWWWAIMQVIEYPRWDIQKGCISNKRKNLTFTKTDVIGVNKSQDRTEVIWVVFVRAQWIDCIRSTWLKVEIEIVYWEWENTQS